MREFIIDENSGGQRLDKYISKLMPGLPKSMLYKGLRKDCVRLNGRHARDGSVFVCAGDEIKLYFKEEFFEPERGFRRTAHPLDIAYEDENILVVNKAVGVVAHADEKGTAGTLVDMVQSYLCDKGEYDPRTEQTFRPALCSRLDRNTGGLIIAAKNARALRDMNERIRLGEVRKFYTAIAEGYTEPSGRLEGFSTRDRKITAISAERTAGARRVSLDYRTIERKNGRSLLEIELHTGRAHQIRAQLAAAGHPLAGDTKYGGHGAAFRQALWSARIKFEFGGADFSLGYLNGREITVVPPFLKAWEKEQGGV